MKPHRAIELLLLIREVQAEAWDEGWRAAWSPMSPDHLDHGPNPYRD